MGSIQSNSGTYSQKPCDDLAIEYEDDGKLSTGAEVWSYRWDVGGMLTPLAKGVIELKDATRKSYQNVMRAGAVPEEQIADAKPPQPERFEHVAIVAFGYIFEFSSGGLSNQKIIGEPETSCAVNGPPRQALLGKTDKTAEEFYNWIQEGREEYNKNNYDVVNNNCLHWAGKAVEFLKVKPDPEWAILADYVQRNSGFTKTVGATIACSNYVLTGGKSSY